MRTTTRIDRFRAQQYLTEVAGLLCQPVSDAGWGALKDDARVCAAEEIGEDTNPLRMTWNPRRKEYTLDGATEALEQFDSLAKRAARRLGYRGDQHVVCLLTYLCSQSPSFEEEYDFKAVSAEEHHRDENGEVYSSQSLIGEPTGSFVIDPLFPAVANLFMRLEAAAEDVDLSKILTAEATEETTIKKIQALLAAASKTADVVLIKKYRKEAVDLRLQMQRFLKRKCTKAALYKAAGQHRSEFFKWLNGKKRSDSVPDRSISRVLVEGYE